MDTLLKEEMAEREAECGLRCGVLVLGRLWLQGGRGRACERRHRGLLNGQLNALGWAISDWPREATGEQMEVRGA
jgi:hypothetical protein